MRPMLERWGTFSVKDHMTKAPFVSDVLLYDRLAIPIPDPADPNAAATWKKWDPHRLQKCLKVLGVKTDKADGLALTVPWGVKKQERFQNRMSTATALATQLRSPDQTYYVDPFAMTRELIRGEFRPALPAGVSKVWALAAYTSASKYRADTTADGRRHRLAAVITHQFLAPTGDDPKQELLKRAVGLATTAAYLRKRASFYQWQEEIIEEQISDAKAIEELNKRLTELNAAHRKAFRDVAAKYAFTVIPIGLTLGGAAVAGAMPALFTAAVGGLVQLARFWMFDRKPVIANGDLDAAAMIRDARKVLSLD